MNRKTVGALLVFLALLGVVYYLQTRPEKGERVGERPRPVPRLSKDKIDKVTITAKGKTVVLERGDKGWRVTRPVVDDADPQATKTMEEKLIGLEFGDLVTERKDRHAEHGVDRAKGVHVVVAKGNKTVADFYLGVVKDGFTMLRAAGKDQVYQAVGTLPYVFAREPRNWRDRTVISLKQQDIRSIELTTTGMPGAGTIVLGRKDEKSEWKVERADIEVQKLDEATASSVVSSLGNLTAFDFADGATPEKVGLDRPTARIVAHLKGGETDTLLIGKQQGDDFWVQHLGDPQIFVVKKYAVNNLLQRPIDFRDKSVLGLKPELVTTLVLQKKKDGTSATLKRRGNDWLSGGKKVKDTHKIKQALDTLSHLRAEGFARNTAQELGLERPDWVAEIRLKDGTRHRIQVGSTERDKHFGVTVQGSPDIYLFRKYTLDRFLLDPKDYK